MGEQLKTAITSEVPSGWMPRLTLKLACKVKCIRVYRFATCS